MFAPSLRTRRTSTQLLRRTTSRRRHVTAPAADPLQFAAGLEPFFADAHDALVVGDLVSGRIIRWNHAAEQLFGYSAAQADGQPVEMLLPPAIARLHREQVAHYVRTGDAEVLTGRGPISMPALTRSRDEVRVELTTSVIEQPGAATRLLLFAFRDASCKKQLELQALEVARVEAGRADVEARLRRCELLLPDSTRELHRPIARARRAAARLARLAADPGETPPRRLALLAQVVEGRTDEVQRTLEMIANSVAIESGTFELDYERVNLVPLVNRLVTAVRARTNTHRVKFGAPQGLTAQCDPRRVEEVLHDLIGRAVRRNPRGSWIDVDLRRPLAGVARIEVRDYGRPVSARGRERILRLSSHDRAWFVNRYIVERHGGTLEIDFPPEGGMRVAVNLPTHRSRVRAV